MGRWQLAQAILLFVTAPLSLLLLVAAVGNVASGGAAATPPGALALLFAATWLASYAPKVAGYAEALLRPSLAARLGGRGAVLRGALTEMAFAIFFDPLSMASKGFFMLSMPFRRGGGWGRRTAPRGA
ncbi:hypothetical protein ACFQU7_02880 [Pseudoroseomonas wenyumeiae]